MDPETTPPRAPDEPDEGPGSETAAAANDEENDEPTSSAVAAAAAAARAGPRPRGNTAATTSLTPLAIPKSSPPSVDDSLSGSGLDDAPLFWTTGSPTRLHQRTVSSVSYQSLSHLRPAAINLEDRSSEDAHETARSCWAQSVSVDEYVVVSGATGIGAYVVWHCTVRTLQGGDLYLRKRYSEFDQLRANLVRAFPHAEAMIPQLPRKSLVSRFRPKFLEQRRAGLSHFLKVCRLSYIEGFHILLTDSNSAMRQGCRSHKTAALYHRQNGAWSDEWAETRVLYTSSKLTKQTPSLVPSMGNIRKHPPPNPTLPLHSLLP